METDLFPPEVPKVDTITVTTWPDGMFLVAAPPDYTLETPPR